MLNTDYPNYPHRDLNKGCGHIYPRPDGHRMRCGGFRGCHACASDALDAAKEWIDAALAADGGRDEIAAAAEMLSDAGRTLRAKYYAATNAVAAQVAAQESSFSSGATGLLQPMPSMWDAVR